MHFHGNQQHANGFFFLQVQRIEREEEGMGTSVCESVAAAAALPVFASCFLFPLLCGRRASVRLDICPLFFRFDLSVITAFSASIRVRKHAAQKGFLNHNRNLFLQEDPGCSQRRENKHGYGNTSSRPRGSFFTLLLMGVTCDTVFVKLSLFGSTQRDQYHFFVLIIKMEE